MSDLSSLLAEAKEVSEGKKKLNEALRGKYKMGKMNLIFRMSEEEFSRADVERTPTGELGLDIASGGGWPRGRFIKISGVYSAGKSKLLATAVAEYTRRLQEDVLVIDVEGTWTKRWLMDMGADITRVYATRPENAEMALDIAEAALESNEYSAIILDSIAAMSPKDEMESSHEEWQRGLLSRLVGKFCRKMEGRMNRAFLHGKDVPTVFLANQVRANMNNPYEPTFTPGGTQQDNTATINVVLSRKRNLWIGGDKIAEEDREYVGWMTQAFFKKNKVAPPLKRCQFGVLNQAFEGHPAHSFYHGHTIASYGLRVGSVIQNGAWYSVPAMDTKVQGMSNLIGEIMEQDGLRDYLVGSVKEFLDGDMEIPFDPNFLEPIEMPTGAEIDDVLQSA